LVSKFLVGNESQKYEISYICVCHSYTCMSVANSTIETSLRKVYIAQFLSKYMSEPQAYLAEHSVKKVR
jgi:hypothetical protein